MKINISISQKEAHACEDNVVAAIAEHYNKNYQLIFAESYGFRYQPPREGSNQILGKRIQSNLGMRFEYAEEFHGVQSHFHTFQGDIEELIQVAKAQLAEAKPVIFYMDLFYCPWMKPHYQVTHTDHLLLLVDLDEVEQTFLCIDGQMALDGVEVSREILMQALKAYASFTLSDDESCPDWRMLIQKTLEQIESEDIFVQIRQLSEEMEGGLDFAAEIAGYEKNALEAPIYQALTDVSNKRKQFSFFLDYLAEYNGVELLKDVAADFNKAGNMWSSIFGLLLKAYYIQDTGTIVGRVAKKIRQVADYEEEIVAKLAKLLQEPTEELKVNLVSRQKAANLPTKITQVDLTDYLNNNGIGEELSPESTAELSQMGRYLLAEELAEEEFLNVDGMQFRLPPIAKGSNDNIVCKGQSILVGPGAYHSLMIMGCAEYGNFIEDLEIVYEDGEIEMISLEVTNWIFAKPSFGEAIAWRGKGAVRSDNSVYLFPFPVHLYANRYQLTKGQKIKEIRLPICPNIHIFAISLGE